MYYHVFFKVFYFIISIQSGSPRLEINIPTELYYIVLKNYLIKSTNLVLSAKKRKVLFQHILIYFFSQKQL